MVLTILQADRAVQLFLETDSSNDNYYVDSLRYHTLLNYIVCKRTMQLFLTMHVMTDLKRVSTRGQNIS